MPYHRTGLINNIIIAAGLALLALVNVGPPLWGFLASLKTNAEIVSNLSTFDFTPTLNNYRGVIETGFLVGMRNSVFYAIVSVVLGLAVGSLAAFGFDRFDFRGRSAFFILLVVASIPLAVGATALIIPNFLFFTQLQLTNTWYTLPLIYTAYSLPMAIWIIKGNIEGIPKELDEAAYIDGASSFAVFRRVILPLSKPVMGAAGFMLFISAWNEFVAGSVMVDSPGLKPIQPLLYSYISDFGREWGLLTAAACMAVLPVFLIYCFFGRLLISGLTRGAVKG